MTKEANTRVVYLPEGSWYDYWAGEGYKGSQHYSIVTPPENSMSGFPVAAKRI